MVSGSRKTLAAIVVLVVQMLFPSVTQASGIGVSPAIIEMNDALRGTEYQRTILLTNAESGEVKFEFGPEGQAGQWATLYPFDGPDTPITSIVAPPKTDVRLKLKLRLPQDAPNGLHSGRLLFRSVLSGPQDQAGSSMAVSVGIGIDLKISVTGTQKVAGQVSDVSLLDVEVDQPPLRLTTLFQNTGNVKTTPHIQLQVKDTQGKMVGETTASDVTVEPGGSERIVSEWDHSGKPAGKYVAAVSVLLQNEKIYQREINFQMLPKGTMTRVGKLEEIKLGSQPQVGGTVKLVGVFQNTGKIDTKAILIGEIYRGDILLRVVEARERMIPAGQIGEMELFFDIPQADRYTVKAKVNYEGKLTETKELEFTVGAPAQAESGYLQLASLALALPAAAVLAIVGGFAFYWRKRNHRIPEGAIAREHRPV